MKFSSQRDEKRLCTYMCNMITYSWCDFQLVSPASTVLLIYAWWLITTGERCAEVRQPFDERSLDAGCYVYCRSSDAERNIDVSQCDV